MGTGGLLRRRADHGHHRLGGLGPAGLGAERPGATIILAIMAAWAAGTALIATFTAKGDYAKARAALRAR